MDTRPHNTIIHTKQLSVPPSTQAMNPLSLDPHTLFVLFLLRGQATHVKKIGTVEERKFRIRGLNNKLLLDLGT